MGSEHTVLLVGTLTDQVATLAVGFVLTTLVGGLLGSWFQQRTWDHQNERTLAEADRAHATEVCRELSQLMDKRLYRMWQVKWAVFADEANDDRVEKHMERYRDVLYEWNDSLMRNLAAMETEFGTPLRHEFEAGIFEGFAAVGRRLEARYLELKRRGEAPVNDESHRNASQAAGHKLIGLRDRIYVLNLKMLRQIRDGRVGRHAPD
jgi:hypothetical protein